MVNEEEILNWIQMYGVVKEKLKKITLNEGSEDEETIGTGVYLVQARLNRLVPNILPIRKFKFVISNSTKSQAPGVTPVGGKKKIMQ